MYRRILSEDIDMKNNEKKNYETPVAVKMMFNYSDQVVAASKPCVSVWVNHGKNECTEGNQLQEFLN